MQERLTIQDVMDKYNAYTTDQPVNAPDHGEMTRLIRKNHPEPDIEKRRIAEKQMLAKALHDAVQMNRRLIELKMEWNSDHELYGYARYTGRFEKEHTSV